MSYLESTLADIRFKNYEYRLRYDGAENEGGRPYLQIAWWGSDIDGSPSRWHYGRKWFLSSYMTKGEIAQTALMATLAIEEHEVREGFTYKGKAIFGPHFNIDKLVEICERGDALEERAAVVSKTAGMQPPDCQTDFNPAI